MFAREFLLPSDIIKKWFAEGLTGEKIAEKTGFGGEVVYHQLAFSLLAPQIPDSDERETDGEEMVLDEYQAKAAKTPEGPQLITAGPGTGKTRALVGRILYLLNEGVDPRSILTLTFSNKAVAELRERIEKFMPEQAGGLTIETFHSFGLELLRKYGKSIGLPAKPKIVDPIDGILMLEEMLPELDLSFYEVLHEPTRHLGDIIRAISRAKDEYVGPERYLELATLQKEAAQDDKGVEQAEKALEVAGVYEKYQRRLVKEGAIDLSDLICRSIDLLNSNDAILKSVQTQYSQVLVDEFQDVNRSSGLFLKTVVGDGKKLWAVGDVRQSIHRWRGATTANIRRFGEDYPDARIPIVLGKNYRSKPSIIRAFEELAPKMKASNEFVKWEPARGDDGVTVSFNVATDRDAESLGIAKEIARLNAEGGVAFKDQAVVCRTHTTLARIARILEGQGIPILYLGDFFERDEVRDLLSLLLLAYEAEGRALFRVARFPEYNIPLDDILRLRRAAREMGEAFPRALALAGKVEGISRDGQIAFDQIAEQIDGLTHGRSAWKTFTRYLFDRSSYLTPLIADESVSGQQKRLAIYQLLRFVHSQLELDARGLDPKQALLKYIRRLEIFNEEKQLRQTDEWAEAIDAVRVLTIHASKGLEFSAVFLPTLAKTYLPMQPPHNYCPPPHGLVDDEAGIEEEECLFFVAMSRARDHLFLSRALKYGKTSRTASVLLDHVQKSFPTAQDDAVSWDDGVEEDQVVASKIDSVIPDIFERSALEVYILCPRRYLYELVLGISGRSDDTAYLQFHKCIYGTLRQIQLERKAGREITEDEALRMLDETWTERGPVDHHLGPKYRSIAETMLKDAVTRLAPRGELMTADVEVVRPEGKIRFEFGHAEMINNVLHVKELKTGRPTKTEVDKKPKYGLMLHALNNMAEDSSLEIHHLGRTEVIPVILTPRKVEGHIGKYDEALAGIGRAEFPPKPGEYQCNRCPQFFICPEAED